MPSAEPLTIFACPKPFVAHAGVIQRNAVASWTRLTPRPLIILFGDEEGTGDLCRDLDLLHVPQIARHERGTPLFDGILAGAQARAAAGPLCFVNADIVLMQDFRAAIDRVSAQKRRYLIVGQRTDLDVTEPIRFDDRAWAESLRRAAAEKGRLHGTFGIDYFVFTRGLFDPAPPLLVGRAAIDNWLIYAARRRRAPVIDATDAILAVHQNHDYSHHPAGRHGVFHGEDAETNWRLAGGHDCRFWISDRTHTLSPAGLKADLSPARLRQQWQRLPVLVPSVLRGPVRLVQKGVRALRRLPRPAQV